MASTNNETQVRTGRRKESKGEAVDAFVSLELFEDNAFRELSLEEQACVLWLLYWAARRSNPQSTGQEHGNAPSDEEAAAVLGLPVQEWKAIKQRLLEKGVFESNTSDVRNENKKNCQRYIVVLYKRSIDLIIDLRYGTDHERVPITHSVTKLDHKTPPIHSKCRKKSAEKQATLDLEVDTVDNGIEDPLQKQTKSNAPFWALELENELFEHANSVVPGMRKPSKATMERNASELAKLHRVDGHSIADIRAVCYWIMNDKNGNGDFPGWAFVATCGRTVRKHWNSIVASMAAEKEAKRARAKAGTGTNGATTNTGSVDSYTSVVKRRAQEAETD